MNRSVLIATADFLVLAALSLSSRIDDMSPSGLSKPEPPQETVTDFWPSTEEDRAREAEMMADLQDDWEALKRLAADENAGDNERATELQSEREAHDNTRQQLEEVTEQAARERARFMTKIAELESGRDDPIWGIQDAMRWGIRTIVREVHHRNERRTTRLCAPAVRIGGKPFLVTNFRALGFGWAEIRRGKVTVVSLVISKKGESPFSKRCHKVYSYSADPRLWFIPLPEDAPGRTCEWHGRDLGELPLKRLRLFKARASLGVTSTELSCGVSRPGVLELTFPPPIPEHRYAAEYGDVVMTHRGEVLGVISHTNRLRTQATCVAVPDGLTENDLRPIPLCRTEGDYCSRFVEAVNAAWDVAD